jgi:hypothetical protein
MSLAVLSSDAVMTYAPSGDSCMSWMQSSWTVASCSSFPVCACKKHSHGQYSRLPYPKVLTFWNQHLCPERRPAAVSICCLLADWTINCSIRCFPALPRIEHAATPNGWLCGFCSMQLSFQLPGTHL